MPVPPGQRGIGPLEALARQISARYLPDLLGPLTRGLAQKNDMITYPAAWLLNIEDEEAREETLRALEAGFVHGNPAFLASGAAAMLENLGAFAGGYGQTQRLLGARSVLEQGNVPLPGEYKPFESLAAPLREKFVEHAQAAQEMMGEDPKISSRFYQGVASSPSWIGEGALATATMGPAGFPVVVASRHARDPVTGDFTGWGEAGTGAGIGVLLNMLGIGASQLSTLPRRAAFQGTGFSALAALEGAEDKDIASNFLLGMAMTGLPQGRVRAAEYQKQAKVAKERAAREVEETGVPEARSQNLPEEVFYEPAGEPGVIRDPSRPAGDVFLEPGGKPRFTVEDEIGLWQENMRGRRIDPESQVGVWARDTKLPKDLPADLELEFMMGEMDKLGGARVYFEGLSAGRSHAETLAAAEDLVYRVGMGMSPRAISKMRQEKRAFDEVELAASAKIVQDRMDAVGVAGSAVPAGSREDANAFIRSFVDMASSEYEFQGHSSVAGRALNILKATKQQRLKSRAIEMVTQQHKQRVAQEAAKAGKKGDLVDEYGGLDQVRALAEMVGRLDDPAEVASVLGMAKQSAERGLAWTLADIWVAGLLGISANVTNVKSNALFAGWVHGVEQPLAAAVGAAKMPLQAAQRKLEVASIRREETARYDSLPSAERRPQQELHTGPDGITVQRDAETPAQSRRRRIDDATDARSPEPATQDRLYAQEILPGLKGLMRGVPKAFEAMQKAWATGEEFSLGGAKGRSKFGTFKEKSKSFPPFRVLTSEDAFFGMATSMGRAYQLGEREAIRLKIPEREVDAYVEQFAADVMKIPRSATDARKAELKRYQKEVMEHSDMLRFVKELGPIGDVMTQFSNVHPLAKAPLPFVRTLVNVSKEIFYRTPFALVGIIPKFGPLVAPKLNADFYAGGQRQDFALARVVAGTGLAMYYWDKFLTGEMTGAPSPDAADRNLERSKGIMPYSYVTEGVEGEPIMQSYARLDPLASVVAGMGTIADWYNQGVLSPEVVDEILPLFGAAFAENFVNKSYLQGPKGAMTALTEPQRHGQAFVEQLVGTIIPSVVNELAIAGDPLRRDRTGLKEAMMSRIPGIRKMLPTMPDLAGRDQIVGDPGLGFGARLGGVYSTPLRPTIVLDAMSVSGSRIQRVGKAVQLQVQDFASKTDPAMTQDALGLQRRIYIKMTPHERAWLEKARNTRAHDFVEPVARGLMAVQDKTESLSLAELQEAGASPDLIDAYRQSRVKSASVNKALRDEIGNAYRLFYWFGTRELIKKWSENGTLRKQLDIQLGQEERRAGSRADTRPGGTKYRMNQSGGPQ